MSADDCVGCKHINNCLGDCVGFAKPKPKPQTNFDRITQSAEALAEWLGNDVCTECYCCHYSGECELKGIDTKKQWLEWLKQESDNK